MDKIYYKELIEKYFDGNITDAEIKKLSDWIKNDRHLQNWWEEEFPNRMPALIRYCAINYLPESKNRRREKKKHREKRTQELFV